MYFYSIVRETQKEQALWTQNVWSGTCGQQNQQSSNVLWKKKTLSKRKWIRRSVLHCFSCFCPELKKVHIEVKETAATQPARKPSAPAEQENGSEEEEEDDEDEDDEEEDEEDESEEDEDEEEKAGQTAKEKSGKEESSESSSESDSDDERTKEERMYDKAKRRIEVQT